MTPAHRLCATIAAWRAFQARAKRKETDLARHIDPQTEISLQAAAFRRLRRHLMEDRVDVQNIDLMNLAGFCRNCLSRWYQEAAAEMDISLDKNEAREIFYGMTMEEWKRDHQTEAMSEQRARFKAAFAENVGKGTDS